jgi:LysR family nitrogen assimilation transcriptional regulator
LEFRQLRYFRVVADAGSFARGALDLRVAQPALSRSVAKLEEEVGTTLFVRHSGGVSLTDAGTRFYDYATQVLSSVRQLQEGMASADGAPRGTVILGAPHSIQSKLILPVAAEFLSRFNLCRLDLIQNTGANLRNQVLEGLIDLAIVPNTVESGMHYRPLLRESICLICKREDRALFGDEIDLDDVLHLPLILTGYPSSLRLYIERQFPHKTDDLNVRSEVNSSSVLTELVTHGVGYGLGPSCVVTQQAQQALACVPIRGLEVAWALATNWHRRGLRAVEELEAMILRHAQDCVSSGGWPTARLEAEA